MYLADITSIAGALKGHFNPVKSTVYPSSLANANIQLRKNAVSLVLQGMQSRKKLKSGLMEGI